MSGGPGDLKLVAVATYPGRHFQAFMASARKVGLEPVILGMNEAWRGFGMKLQRLDSYVRSLPDPRTRVLFADAHDSLILQPPEKILELFESIPAPIVVSAEKACWPDPWKAPYYPRTPHPWKYLNSGGILGEVKALLEFFGEFGKWIADDYDDQRWWTDCYFSDYFVTRKRRIHLDTECRIFQTLWSSAEDLELGKALINRVTGTQPGVLHGNGWADMLPVLHWMGLGAG